MVRKERSGGSRRPGDAGGKGGITLDLIERAVRAVMSIPRHHDLFAPPKRVRDSRGMARDLAVHVAFECGFGSRQIAEFTHIDQSYVSNIARRFARKLRSQLGCQDALRQVERELRRAGAHVA
jgi:DNA-binding NarL/FixJ family response regulator